MHVVGLLDEMKMMKSIVMPTLQGSYRQKENVFILNAVVDHYGFDKLPDLESLKAIMAGIDKYFLHAISGPDNNTTAVVSSRWVSTNAKLLKRMIGLRKRSKTSRPKGKAKSVDVSSLSEEAVLLADWRMIG